MYGVTGAFRFRVFCRAEFGRVTDNKTAWMSLQLQTGFNRESLIRVVEANQLEAQVGLTANTANGELCR